MKQSDVDELLFSAIKYDLCWDVPSTSWEEISSGNINYIYRIKNKENQKSVILKFASEETRVRPDGFLSPKRNEHEAGVLNWYEKVVPNYVPRVFSINAEKHYFLMEDIVDACSLRDSLMKGALYKELGKTLAYFIVHSTFPLLDMARDDRQVDRPCSFSYSNDLVRITEELVFVAPYYNPKNRNRYTKGNETFIKERLKSCKLQAVVFSLLEKFKTYKQSLIHGDLHTGSILIKTCNSEVLSNDDDLMNMFVVDPEFAFYGPIAYDVGNVLAHLHFAKLYKSFTLKNEEERSIYVSYYQDQIENFLNFFAKEGVSVLKNIVCNEFYRNVPLLSGYIESIIDDAFRYAGCEIIRRVVGSTKVPELEAIQDEESLLLIEQSLIDIGIDFILNASKAHLMNKQ